MTPSSFGKILMDSCDENNIFISSKIFLPSDTFTYVSERWETSSSWLDHCICTEGAHESIKNFKVWYHAAATDHIPIGLELTSDSPHNSLNNNSFLNTNKNIIRWADLSDQDLIYYIARTKQLLLEIPTATQAFNCVDFNCRDPNHVREFCDYYKAIVVALKNASQPLYETQKSKKKSFPGWNDYVQESHALSIDAMHQWRNAGMPSQGPIYENKKKFHKKYKADVRRARRNETNFLKNKLAEKLILKNGKNFWKDVRCIMGDKRVTATSIEGVSGEEDIAKLWKTHYEKIFNCYPDNNFSVNNVPMDFSAIITPSEILENIGKIKCTNSPGPDGISAEHLKFASTVLSEMLVNCFSAIMTHGVIPSEMFDVHVVPVVKDNRSSLSKMDNYRPIATASCFLNY